MRDKIIELILKGATYKEIIEQTGAAKSTISYHASKLGNPNRRSLSAESLRALSMIEERYDNKTIAAETGVSITTICQLRKKVGIASAANWSQAEWFDFQKLYDTGISVRACCKQLGIPTNAVYKAKRDGHIKLRKSQFSYDEILVENSSYQRGNLKRRLIADKILAHECAACGIGPIWNDQPLTLSLDHINGVNNDNRIENLRLLCPNCHSQTPTFAGRNVKNRS